MEKRTVRTNPHRTSVRWICHNPICPVIFVEERRNGRQTVARDPTMERITIKTTETIGGKLECQ